MEAKNQSTINLKHQYLKIFQTILKDLINQLGLFRLKEQRNSTFLLLI